MWAICPWGQSSGKYVCLIICWTKFIPSLKMTVISVCTFWSVKFQRDLCFYTDFNKLSYICFLYLAAKGSNLVQVLFFSSEDDLIVVLCNNEDENLASLEVKKFYFIKNLIKKNKENRQNKCFGKV